MAYTVTDVAPRVRYTATASQTLFTIPFEFPTNGSIKFYRNEVELTYSASPADNTEYSLTGVATTGGGSATLGGTGADLNDDILIIRDLPVERSTDFPTSGIFDTGALNDQLDELTAMVQQQEQILKKRTLTLPDTDLPEELNRLPDKATRAGKIFSFDSDGQPSVDNSAADSAVAASASAAAASSSASTAASSASAAATSASAAASSASAAAASAATAASEVATGLAAIASNTISVDGATTIGDVSSEGGDLFRFHTSAGTANLVAAATAADEFSAIIKADGVQVTIDPAGAETINGASTLVLEDGQSARVFCDGTAWQAVLIGSGSGGLTPVFTSGTYNANAGEQVKTDVSAAVSTVNLPSSPSDLDVVEVSDYQNSSATYAITVGRGGSNIDGAAENYTIGENGGAVRFTYNDTASTWETELVGGIFQDDLLIKATFEFTATAGQTVLTGGGLTYVPNNVQVSVNGTVLRPSDYTATDGSTITLDNALVLSDEVLVTTFNSATLNSFGGIAQNITPDADGTRDIGSTLTRWANVWTDNINGGTPAVSTDLDFVFIEEVSGTNVASVDIAIPSGYSMVEIRCSNLFDLGANGVRFRTSNDGGSTFTSSAGAYDYAASFDDSSGNRTGIGSLSSTELFLFGATAGLASEEFGFVLEVFNPHDSGSKTKFRTRGTGWRWNGDYICTDFAGQRAADEANDYLQIAGQTGNITGTFRVYGVR